MGRKFYLALCAVVGIALTTVGPASATTFTVGNASSVSLTPTGGFGSGCFGAGNCISESLAAGLVGNTFDLDNVGDSATFDFLTFTPQGFGAYENYDVSATLAFSAPVTGASSGGSAGVVGIGFGGFVAGVLNWDILSQNVAFGVSGLINIAFQGGLDFLSGPVTTSATVTLVQADVSPVPLPAGGLLILAGLGGLAVLRRRKKIA